MYQGVAVKSIQLQLLFFSQRDFLKKSVALLEVVFRTCLPLTFVFRSFDVNFVHGDYHIKITAIKQQELDRVRHNSDLNMLELELTKGESLWTTSINKLL